ncbi:MAG TPA: thiamine-phosphate kinase [Gemmatimonadales bacterium]|nr:thiamine-phosphate kinase [Gemmatimonadales bacterium]
MSGRHDAGTQMTLSGLGAGAEFDRIRAIAAALASGAGALDDDCALVPVCEGQPERDAVTLALSTDASIEGVHFRREWLAFEEIGWRAAAAALSDLAAEGAEPIGLLAAVAAPLVSGAAAADGSGADLVAIMRGVGAAAASVGARVLGGDLSTGPVWSITATVVGRAVRPVTRAGAESGDGIWVTGALGGARAAVLAWRRGEEPAPAARRAFAHPEPRIAAGRWLAGHGARAMLDLSDGLAGDAEHLAAASRVALEFELERIPVAEGVEPAVADAAAASAFAAEGGEDYELLAALPPAFGSAGAAAFTAATGLRLTRIGLARQGAGVRFLARGAAVTLRGFDHFR